MLYLVRKTSAWKEKVPEEDHPGAALGRKSPAEGCPAPVRCWQGGARCWPNHKLLA